MKITLEKKTDPNGTWIYLKREGIAVKAFMEHELEKAHQEYDAYVEFMKKELEPEILKQTNI